MYRRSNPGQLSPCTTFYITALISAALIFSLQNGIRVPNIVYHENDERPDFNRPWRPDDAFARLMTSGLSPVDLKLISRIPLEFGVTDDMIPGGDTTTIESELSGKRLFLLDLDDIKSLAGSYEIGDATRYFAVPFALFHVSKYGKRLMPVAIQIDRNAGSLVFTPKDDPNDWLAARMFLNNCHFQVHQFRSHALACHFMQEPMSVGTSRNLPSSHPIFKLLRPHFNGLISINNTSRGSLVNSEDYKSLARVTGDLFSMGAHGNTNSAIVFYKNMTFESFFFYNRLRANGVLDEGVIEDYPYRDDGRLVMTAIENYVRGIVRLYYPDDESVTNDEYIQAWAQDLVQNGMVRSRTLDGMSSIASLSYFCSNIIFTASAFHAAVNFNQVAIAGNTANIPGSLYRPPPAEKGRLRERDLVDFLQPNGKAQVQIGLMGLLSSNSGDRLGYFRERLFVDQEALKIQEAVSHPLFD